MKHFIKTWWLWILPVGGAALFYFPPLAPFQLKEVVVVTPTTRLSEVELVKLTGVRKGDSLLTLRLKKIRENLLKFPWIEEVALAKAYPGRLVVSVKEQSPVSLVKLDSLYLVNAKGEIFKKVAGGDPKNLPVLTGFKKPTAVDLLPLITLLNDFQDHEVLRSVGLSEINWSPESGVSIFTVKPVVKVKLGKDRWNERLKKLAHVLPGIRAKKKTPPIIDLTYEKRIFVKQS